MKIDMTINTEELIVGLNWSAIEETGWFGAIDYRYVDLDLSVILIDRRSQKAQMFNHQNRPEGWGEIGKDDMSGDVKGSDQLDNEWIKMQLNQLKEKSILLCFSNYTEQYLLGLPQLQYRIYSGEPNSPEKVYHEKVFINEHYLNSAQSIFVGFLSFEENGWLFYEDSLPLDCIGEDMLEEIINYYKHNSILMIQNLGAL